MRAQIEDELRLLRRLPGALTDTKLVRTPALLKGLGNGDVEVAMNRLLLLRRSNDGDDDVAVAFASIGFGAEGTTVLERLENIASDQYVDARTVRRRSDNGLKKLAALVLGVGPWIDPQIELVLSISDSQLVAATRFRVPLHIDMHMPRMLCDGDDIGLDWTRVAAPKGDPDRHRAEPITVQLVSGATHSIDLHWRGELCPTFITDVRRLDGWSCRSRLRLWSLRVTLDRDQ